MKESYVGITGFMSSGEVTEVISKSFWGDNDPLLMVGVLMSSKTLGGKRNKWSKRYPFGYNISTIFPSHPRALNLIHFSTDYPDNLDRELFEAVRIGGERLHGFQLNVVWPKIHLLRAFKKSYPEMKLVLQLGNKAIIKAGKSRKVLAQKVADYQGLIDYVLLDGSGGYGLAFDFRSSYEYLSYLSEVGIKYNIGIGLAGGMCAAEVDRFYELRRCLYLPNGLSTDAEGRLRDRFDQLDIAKAVDYLRTMREYQAKHNKE